MMILGAELLIIVEEVEMSWSAVSIPIFLLGPTLVVIVRRLGKWLVEDVVVGYHFVSFRSSSSGFLRIDLLMNLSLALIRGATQVIVLVRRIALHRIRVRMMSSFMPSSVFMRVLVHHREICLPILLAPWNLASEFLLRAESLSVMVMMSLTCASCSEVVGDIEVLSGVQTPSFPSSVWASSRFFAFVVEPSSRIELVGAFSIASCMLAIRISSLVLGVDPLVLVMLRGT